MALAVYRRHAFSLWRVVAVVVALPAALNGALAVAEQQVRDSDGSSGSLAVLQVLLLVVSLIASSLATAAAYRLVADASLGRALDPAPSPPLRPRARPRPRGPAARRGPEVPVCDLDLAAGGCPGRHRVPVPADSRHLPLRRV